MFLTKLAVQRAKLLNEVLYWHLYHFKGAGISATARDVKELFYKFSFFRLNALRMPERCPNSAQISSNRSHIFPSTPRTGERGVPIPSLLECSNSMRGADAPSASMSSADCLSRANSHRTPADTRFTFSTYEYSSCTQKHKPVIVEFQMHLCNSYLLMSVTKCWCYCRKPFRFTESLLPTLN